MQATNKGYNVVACAKGTQGSPCWLVLDLMPPRINPYETSRAARSKQLDMSIITLTAKGQEDDVVGDFAG